MHFASCWRGRRSGCCGRGGDRGLDRGLEETYGERRLGMTFAELRRISVMHVSFILGRAIYYNSELLLFQPENLSSLPAARTSSLSAAMLCNTSLAPYPLAVKLTYSLCHPRYQNSSSCKSKHAASLNGTVLVLRSQIVSLRLDKRMPLG